MVVQFSPLGKADELQKMILEAAVERVFGDTGDIRTHEEFELRLQGFWHKLPKTVQEVSALCGQILTEFHGVSLRLGAKVPLMWTPSVDDVREQLSLLITKDFLTQTPMDWLPELPRYLRGMALRLQKLAGAGGGFQRDEKARMEISPLWLAYLRRNQEHIGRGLRDEVLEQYRWLLEELRISLFAQELGTKVSVSVPRLLKVWEQIQR